MKKLLLLLLIVPILGFGQGEQRYADGTATDQDGNTFEWINYGNLDWAIENAEVVTYRDGTPLIKANTRTNSQYSWNSSLTDYAHFNYDDNKSIFYKWDVIKQENFPPIGWRVPLIEDWENLKSYLISNGYNFNGSLTENKIGKSMSSKTGWQESNKDDAPGKNSETNNLSGMNMIPNGSILQDGTSYDEGGQASFWSNSLDTKGDRKYVGTSFNWPEFDFFVGGGDFGFSVRFVRDAYTASTNKYSNVITIYPNPTTSIVTLQGGKQYDIEVYTLQGKKVMALTGNTIDMSHLSAAPYIVKALDKVENEEVSYKVVKN